MINIHIINSAAIDYNRDVVPKARNVQFKSVTDLVSKLMLKACMVNNSHKPGFLAWRIVQVKGFGHSNASTNNDQPLYTFRLLKFDLTLHRVEHMISLV